MNFKFPSYKTTKNFQQPVGPLIGVIVSKTVKFAFVWTPDLGEGIVEINEKLTIGGWIEFMAE